MTVTVADAPPTPPRTRVTLDLDVSELGILRDITTLNITIPVALHDPEGDIEVFLNTLRNALTK